MYSSVELSYLERFVAMLRLPSGAMLNLRQIPEEVTPEMVHALAARLPQFESAEFRESRKRPASALLKRPAMATHRLRSTQSWACAH